MRHGAKRAGKVAKLLAQRRRQCGQVEEDVAVPDLAGDAPQRIVVAREALDLVHLRRADQTAARDRRSSRDTGTGCCRKRPGGRRRRAACRDDGRRCETPRAPPAPSPTMRTLAPATSRRTKSPREGSASVRPAQIHRLRTGAPSRSRTTPDRYSNAPGASFASPCALWPSCAIFMIQPRQRIAAGAPNAPDAPDAPIAPVALS